jgi:hypothetical protein
MADRLRLTSSGQFEFEDSNEETAESSTESTEVEASTTMESDSPLVWGEESIQFLDFEINKSDIVIGLLVLNIVLQAGDFYND